MRERVANAPASTPPPGGVRARARWGAALLVGAAVAAITAAPFAWHVAEALPGGRLSAGGQRAFWLPWQLYANVVSGRGVWDSSGLLAVPDTGLWALMGNPGPAAFIAPLHALGAPVLAHNIGLLMLVWTNAAAGFLLGDTLTPRPRGLLAAALVGAAGLLTWQLGLGALAAAWVAPGLLALAAVRSGSPAMFYAAAAVGVYAAPIPTAAALLAGAALPGGHPTLRGPAGWVCGLGALSGFLLPAALGGGATYLPPSALAWPASGAAPGLPLVVPLGLALGWSGHLSRRAGGAPRAGRLLALGALLTFVLAIGPSVRDTSGKVVEVAGYLLPTAPELAAFSDNTNAMLTAVFVAGALAALGAAAWARLGRAAELALVAVVLVEPHLQAVWGQPVGLWQGETWPVPAALTDLSRSPYSTGILELPMFGITEGLVGLVPFHRQGISGGPGLDKDGPVRAAVERAVATHPALASLAQAGGGSAARDIGPSLGQIGFGWVLVAGAQPSLRVAVQRALGRPTYEDDLYALWQTTPPPPPGQDGQRGERGGPPPSQGSGAR